MATKRRRITGYNRSDKAFQKLVIEAFIHTPMILLGSTKCKRKKALGKWFKSMQENAYGTIRAVM